VRSCSSRPSGPTRIASLLAEHDYETNLHAFERIEAVHVRLTELAEANKTPLEQNAAILARVAGPGLGADAAALLG
jgi:hypothetical protein